MTASERKYGRTSCRVRSPMRGTSPPPATQAASAEEKTVPLPNAPPLSVVPKPDEIGSTVGGEGTGLCTMARSDVEERADLGQIPHRACHAVGVARSRFL